MTKKQRKNLRKVLSDYKYITAELADKNKELAELKRGSVGGSKIAECSYRPVGTTSDPTAGAAVRIETLAKQIEELFEKKNSVDNAMSCLTLLERRIIKYKWFEGTPWSRMSDKFEFSEKHLQLLERVALEKVYRQINKGK